MTRLIQIDYGRSLKIKILKVVNPFDHMESLFMKEMQHFRIDEDYFFYHRLSWYVSKYFLYIKTNNRSFPLPCFIMGVEGKTKYNKILLEKHFDLKLFEIMARNEWKIKFPNYYILPTVIEFTTSKEEELDQYKQKIKKLKL